MEVNKFEYYPNPTPIYWYDGLNHTAQNYAVESYQQNYAMRPVYENQGYVSQAYWMDNHQYGGYNQAHAPQMFSDENPNACSVM